MNALFVDNGHALISDTGAWGAPAAGGAVSPSPLQRRELCLLLASSLGTTRGRGMGAGVEHPHIASSQPAQDMAAKAVLVESRGFISQGISKGVGRVYEM